ncbi:protease pro-enzyme activation domain-containing protein [Dyella sp. S184]|uniref:S53 family peptidase n=1 Tax=Dyella sp. S184 TaxID=1641862 RepID=UPI00131CF8B9|nr:protease pro-enzyme activation domain-containing protein [Dyella sp. S184]
MKQTHFILSACIATALASGAGALKAQTATGMTSATATIDNANEAPRVTLAVTNANVTMLPRTHLGFVAKASSSVPLASETKMNHLQLVLKPSAMRTAAMEGLIANQHNPKSAQFQKWLTPAQFGEQFGVVDSDIAAVTAWLTAQGFTVNNVYPNKTQIDFSGTVAQVNQAFHTQESIYTLGKDKHLANASDISVPAALQPVIAGVMGLNDFHPTALHTASKSKIAQWSGSKKGFVPTTTNPTTGAKVIGQALAFGGSLRGLVPNDMATMYGIKTIRANGVTGKGITIAVVENGDMVPSDWSDFVSQFNLGQYGGTFNLINPAPTSGPNNCSDPSVATFGESVETILDAEWATAIAPGASIEVATCSNDTADLSGPSTTNFFGGTFIAATNLVNGATRPDVISASYGFGEFFVDSASKTAIDLMWAQADAEGISVFVSTGDSGSNPSFNGELINGAYGNNAVDANAFATSPHDTGVGGTDLADVLDGTTSQYFAATPSAVGGSALSYVPEIPWNASCANGVAATSAGYSSAVAFCLNALKHDPSGWYFTSEGSSGGPSSVDAKPAWQRQIYNAAKDQSRDLPDVVLFGGSYGGNSLVILCTAAYPCLPGWTGPVELVEGTSLSAPMFAGVQALMDQGLAARGLPTDQGNAAPTLYALAANEYGGATGPTPASLAACNANNGATGTGSCVFHNVTRGSNSTQCFAQTNFTTPNCYYYGVFDDHNSPSLPPYTNPELVVSIGLTTADAAPTAYGTGNKAFGAQPGWSFASGLGSVNATNLLIAWRAFVNAPSAAPQ